MIDRPSTPVNKIVVTKTAYSDPDAHEIVHANVRFVNTLLGDGGYVPRELPRNAMLSYHVDYYLAQVLNGGLGQFVHNSHWRPQIVQDCLAGLEAMGADAHYEIFVGLKELLDSDPNRAKEISDGGGFGDIDPAISTLEDAFDESGHETIREANAKWLKSLPELKRVRDSKYEKTIAALQNANPLRSVRLAARKRAEVQYCLEKPLQAGARVLCWEAWKVPVREITAGAFGRPAPDGRQTTSWRVHTTQGSHNVYFLDDVAFLCDRYLEDGRRITADLMEEARAASAGNSELALAHHRAVDKENTCIPMNVISKAIDRAKALPVATAAYLLCDALEPPEELIDASPVPDEKLEFNVWAIATDKRVCFLTFGETGAVLTDGNKKLLAKLDDSDIQAVVKADAELES